MLLSTMTVIAVLLTSVTCRREMTGTIESEEADLSDRQLWLERKLRRRERYNNLRLAVSRRRRENTAEDYQGELLDEEEDQRLPEDLPLRPLQLPDDVREPSLEEARLEALHRYRPDQDSAPPGYSVCCPVREERTSPRAGRRRDGSLAILYTDQDFTQMFFERSCPSNSEADIAGHMERSLRRRVRCVQEYSHSYAVYNINGSKVLDYIRIRSGCKCEIKHKSRRKRKRRRNRRREQSEEVHRTGQPEMPLAQLLGDRPEVN